MAYLDSYELSNSGEHRSLYFENDYFHSFDLFPESSLFSEPQFLPIQPSFHDSTESSSFKPSPNQSTHDSSEILDDLHSSPNHTRSRVPSEHPQPSTENLFLSELLEVPGTKQFRLMNPELDLPVTPFVSMTSLAPSDAVFPSVNGFEVDSPSFTETPSRSRSPRHTKESGKSSKHSKDSSKSKKSSSKSHKKSSKSSKSSKSGKSRSSKKSSKKDKSSKHSSSSSSTSSTSSSISSSSSNKHKHRSRSSDSLSVDTLDVSDSSKRSKSRSSSSLEAKRSRSKSVSQPAPSLPPKRQRIEILPNPPSRSYSAVMTNSPARDLMTGMEFIDETCPTGLALALSPKPQLSMSPRTPVVRANPTLKKRASVSDRPAPVVKSISSTAIPFSTPNMKKPILEGYPYDPALWFPPCLYSASFFQHILPIPCYLPISSTPNGDLIQPIKDLLSKALESINTLSGSERIHIAQTFQAMLPKVSRPPEPTDPEVLSRERLVDTSAFNLFFHPSLPRAEHPFVTDPLVSRMGPNYAKAAPVNPLFRQMLYPAPSNRMADIRISRRKPPNPIVIIGRSPVYSSPVHSTPQLASPSSTPGYSPHPQLSTPLSSSSTLGYSPHPQLSASPNPLSSSSTPGYSPHPQLSASPNPLSSSSPLPNPSSGHLLPIPNTPLPNTPLLNTPLPYSPVYYFPHHNNANHYSAASSSESSVL